MSISYKLRGIAVTAAFITVLGAASAAPAFADWHGDRHEGGEWRGGRDHDGWRWRGDRDGWRDGWHGGWRGYYGGGYYAPGYYGYGYTYAPPVVVYPPSYGYGGW